MYISFWWKCVDIAKINWLLASKWSFSNFSLIQLILMYSTRRISPLLDYIINTLVCIDGCSFVVHIYCSFSAELNCCYWYHIPFCGWTCEICKVCIMLLNTVISWTLHHNIMSSTELYVFTITISNLYVLCACEMWWAFLYPF